MATENTHFGAERIGRMLRGARRIFFIGIGGINMSSLADITHTLGYEVGGSDRTMTTLTESLAKKGIRVFYGHDGSNVEGYDAVVYTVAISPDNPEYIAAGEKKIPCISRADYLGYLMTGYGRRIGIAGMHGKSSCTSMCAHTLIEAGADPTVLSGAPLATMGGAYRVGGEDNFLFEACEYMDSFLDFNPTVAVILNVEMDHVDYFHSMEQVYGSFGRFAALTGERGCCIYNADDRETVRSLREYGGERITFGIDSEDAIYRATDITEERGCYSFDLLRRGASFARITLSVTGYHHIYNALATAAVCDLCGLSGQEIARGLAAFVGAGRRMERKGSLRGAPVYDDYGHHPTEIRTTLRGAKGLTMEGGRLFCVYQPHTYSRTQALFDGFVDALRGADRVILTDIYAARETDTMGVSSALLARTVGERAVSCDSFSEAARVLCREVTERDVVVIMGAGDVYKIFDDLKEEREYEWM